MLQGADWQVVEDREGCEVREALSWEGWSLASAHTVASGAESVGRHSPRQLLCFKSC